MCQEWTDEQIAAGYEEMAEINLAIAQEFFLLEEEIAIK